MIGGMVILEAGVRDPLQRYRANPEAVDAVEYVKKLDSVRFRLQGLFILETRLHDFYCRNKLCSA